MRTPNPAFSLVELSIVLVILGLLVGGILAGQSLIRASELRAIGSEYQRYVTSLHAFRDKYMALPGDMVNATAFWNTATNCPGTNLQPSTDATTCNGNGNDKMESNPGAGYGNEHFRFWQQMANAGLVEGTYTGVRGTGSVTNSNIGINVPRSKYPNTGWTFVNFSTTNSAYWWWQNYGNHFIFGGGGGTTATEQIVLVPADVWGLDKKLDDGVPATGKVRSNLLCTDAADGSAITANYLLDSTDRVCALRFLP